MNNVNTQFEYFGSNYKDSPPILKINNFYTADELQRIWRELEYIFNSSKLTPPDLKNSACKNGVPIKNNFSVYLDDVYSDREFSEILTVNRKIFIREFIQTCISINPIFKYIEISNRDSTLVSYYNDACNYAEHEDAATISCISYFFKEPQRFHGGEIVFRDYDIKLEIQNNMLVIFPSCLTHEVLPVKTHENYEPGYGRYSMTQFLLIREP
jgi:hypothetical protein